MSDQKPIFDPNGVGVKGSLFGLPYDTDEADIVVIPVPWDVTVSYGGGTADGPGAILEASSQIDYAQTDIAETWKVRIAMAEIPQYWYEKSYTLREKATWYIDWLEEGSDDSMTQQMEMLRQEINEGCSELMSYVKEQCRYWQKQGKLTILLGGDHSTPLGHMLSMSEKYGSFGVLQIDAHADLREAYEGFTYSHASIMYNVLQSPQLTKLVQVGIRDFCEEEKNRIVESQGRIETWFDQEMKAEGFEGKTWERQCAEIVRSLPQKVYVSFDIDGLHPSLCPNTGTPVPGGLDFAEAMYLLKSVVKSGRTIIGCDLNEVAPGDDEWDANVGARVLYRMALLMAVSNGIMSFAD